VSVDDRLASLGLDLPGPYPPHDPLNTVDVHVGRARTSGQLPRNRDGVLVNPGTLGLDLTVDEGTEAARWCALNALSVLRAELGTLDRIKRVLTVLGSSPVCRTSTSRPRSSTARAACSSTCSAIADGTPAPRSASPRCHAAEQS
jgi:YjgF/chorismate_mutase-like, putative endoribonuclease